jgi:hypothetical protein
MRDDTAVADRLKIVSGGRCMCVVLVKDDLGVLRAAWLPGSRRRVWKIMFCSVGGET